MRASLPVKAVFNATGAAPDAGRVLRAAMVICLAVGLVLAILSNLDPRGAAVP